jgi:NAD(P)-dependent dehydrogenase (short-subunit alcohol dehydrogenase family)
VVPLGRFATVDEVAGLVVALCTEETAYMTGTILDVNGASYSA